MLNFDLILIEGTVNGAPCTFQIFDQRNNREANHVYSLYAAMNGINTPDVLEYGIQSVLYVGVLFGKFDILALTAIGGKSLTAKYKITEKQIMKLPPITLLKILQQSIRIMKYFHGSGVIHNDISPDNIIMQGSKMFITGKI